MRLPVVSVVGSSGGLGSSSLAVAIAVRAARAGLMVTCVDLDVLGGGLDVWCGAEQEPGLRWTDLAGLSGSADGPGLRARLPRAGGVPVLSFGRTDPVVPDSSVVAEVVRALTQASDLLVLDVPRDGSLTSVALEQCTLAIVVTGAGVGHLSALCAVAARVASVVDEVFVCLRTGRRGDDLAWVVEEAVDLPVLGYLRDDGGAAGDLVHGIPPGSRSRGPLTAMADQVLAQLMLSDRIGVA